MSPVTVALVTAPLAAIAAWALGAAVVAGEIDHRRGHYSRTEEPFKFWALFACWSAIPAAFAVSLLRAFGIGPTVTSAMAYLGSMFS